MGKEPISKVLKLRNKNNDKLTITILTRIFFSRNSKLRYICLSENNLDNMYYNNAVISTIHQHNINDVKVFPN